MMQRIWKTFTVLSVVFGLSVAGVSAYAVPKKTPPVKVKASTVVAKLYGKQITLGDLLLYYQATPQLQRIPFNTTQGYQVVLQQYVAARLLNRKARPYYRKLPASQRRQIRKLVSLYRNSLINDLYLTEKFSKKIKVTDKEVREFYDNGVKNDLFKQPKRVQISDSVLQTKSEAKKVAKALKKGKDLKQLLSEKPYSGYVYTQKGKPVDLAPDALVRSDMIDQNLRKAVSKADVGDVVGPIALPSGGYAVFKVVKLKKAGTLSLDESRPFIKQRLTQQALAAESVAYIKTLLKKALTPAKGKKASLQIVHSSLASVGAKVKGAK